MQILMGLIGMVALLAIAVLLSNNRKAINLRTVLGAWIIQVGIGALILYVPAGRSALLAMSNGVASVIAYGNEGSALSSVGWSPIKCSRCLAAAASSLPCACCR